ncbi:histidine phosphatase family protein [Polynucleobacter sp.]|jgi:probable phosphoglycerate mutase|uniref:histidine phosphatase family protein n=1 Tax=Polynucleobacter sp. TaxID=2029855 RepID=UPI0027351D0A|nr:histidine phosphatase family protein [Polynucleobacter sp.]MDP3121335.1 histidine phosphatase family protein [Polynucleobacter sp.]
MSTITRICFARHGETDWNAERRMQGHIDTPLNSHGQAQAQRLAQSLQHAGHTFNHLYSSDLQRAADTAKQVSHALGLSITIDPIFRERHVGVLQGLRLDDAPHAVPEVWQAHLARDIQHDLGGGESIQAFHERAQRALAMLVAAHQGQTILVVSHGGTLDMMYRIASKQALDQARVAVVPNTSLNWIAYDGKTWSVERWADTDHLSTLALDNVDL